MTKGQDIAEIYCDAIFRATFRDRCGASIDAAIAEAEKAQRERCAEIAAGAYTTACMEISHKCYPEIRKHIYDALCAEFIGRYVEHPFDEKVLEQINGK